MKGLLLALVFANLAFLGYARFVGGPARDATLPPSGPAVPRLQLASEVGGPRAGRCYAVGPFADQAVAERASLWLRSARLEPRLRSARRDSGTAYWVSLEAPTLQQATRVAMRLRAGGVADVEVLPPAEEAAAAVVSLGLYSERERAERRIDELRAFAVAPTIAEQVRSVPAWWIDVDLPAGAAAPDVTGLLGTVPEARGVAVASCPAAAAPAPLAEPPATSPSTPRTGAPAAAPVAPPADAAV